MRNSRTYASRGAFIGSAVGLLLVWCLLTNSLGAEGAPHSSLFAPAVMVLCVFSLILFFVFAAIGALIGRSFRRKSLSKQQESEMP